MNIKPYYPNLDLGAIASLSALRQQVDLHPDYFDNEGCPYDDQTRSALKRVFAPREIEVEKIVTVEKIVEKRIEVAAEGLGKVGRKPKLKGAVEIDEVAQEIADIRTELRQMKLDGKALQTSDRLNMIKTRASLVERVVQMAERAQNVKKMSIFQSTVMGILDDLMDDERRAEFARRLEPFAAAE